MSFKDMVAADNHDVFLNLEEFAERRTVKYDGEVYENIPIVLTGLREQERSQTLRDHDQGLYRVNRVLHCARSDLGDNQPEQGSKIQINSREGGTFFREYYVANSVTEMGMLRVELEGIDE